MGNFYDTEKLIYGIIDKMDIPSFGIPVDSAFGT